MTVQESRPSDPKVRLKQIIAHLLQTDLSKDMRALLLLIQEQVQIPELEQLYILHLYARVICVLKRDDLKSDVISILVNSLRPGQDIRDLLHGGYQNMWANHLLTSMQPSEEYSLIVEHLKQTLTLSNQKALIELALVYIHGFAFEDCFEKQEMSALLALLSSNVEELIESILLHEQEYTTQKIYVQVVNSGLEELSKASKELEEAYRTRLIEAGKAVDEITDIHQEGVQQNKEGERRTVDAAKRMAALAKRLL